MHPVYQSPCFVPEFSSLGRCMVKHGHFISPFHKASPSSSASTHTHSRSVLYTSRRISRSVCVMIHNIVLYRAGLWGSQGNWSVSENKPWTHVCWFRALFPHHRAAFTKTTPAVHRAHSVNVALLKLQLGWRIFLPCALCLFFKLTQDAVWVKSSLVQMFVVAGGVIINHILLWICWTQMEGEKNKGINRNEKKENNKRNDDIT